MQEGKRARREGWFALRKRTFGAQPQAPESSASVLLADVHRKVDAPDTQFDTAWDDLSGVEVVAGEFVTVTADPGAAPVHEPIRRMLHQVRERTGMDVVFISQFVNGTRLVRHVAASANDARAAVEGVADPLEATYCQRVLDGRLPPALEDARANAEAATLPVTRALDVRAHVGVPIVTADGRVFGTVCAYAHAPRHGLGEALRVLGVVARALAAALEKAEQA